jgi:predicted amidohydrolase YtcJ
MQSADFIVTNSRILTMDANRPRAQALAVQGDKIVAVGTAQEVNALRGPKTRVIDNHGKSVIPGIVEGHVHLFIGSVELGLPNVAQCANMEDLRAVLKQHVQRHPAQTVVMAVGAVHDLFHARKEEPRHLLDQILPDIQLIVGCFDHHTVWANTRALEAAKLMHGMALPPGNEVVLNKDGVATGELREPAAFAPVLALTPTGGRESLGFTTGCDPSPPATSAQKSFDLDILRKGIAYANSLGITSMHNMDGNRYQLELLRELETQNNLHARVEVPFHYKNTFSIADLDEAVSFREDFNSDMLHSGRVKLFIDGVLETLTAQVIDDYPGFPGKKGAPLYTPEDFAAIVERADSLGLQISTHAIGDGGVRSTLDAYDRARRLNGKRDSRHRIEHIEMIDPSDIIRMVELDVVASVQPRASVFVPGNPHEPILSRVGRKLPYCYAWQTLRNAGVKIAFSSDWPVAGLDPFLGMEAAMTAKSIARDCPDQSQSLADTLHAFTLAGADMEFMQDRKGMIKEGHYADIAVLDADLESATAEAVGKTKVSMTVCAGQVVFEASS